MTNIEAKKSNVATGGSQISTGSNSPIIKGDKNKINLKIKFFISGFIMGVITSVLGSIIVNKFF